MLKNKQRMILKMSMLTVMFNVKGMERGPNEFDRTMDTTSNELHTSMDISMEQENTLKISAKQYVKNIEKLVDKIKNSGNTVKSSDIDLQEIENLFNVSRILLIQLNKTQELLEIEKRKNHLEFLSKGEELKFDVDLQKQITNVKEQQKTIQVNLEQLQVIKCNWLIDRYNILVEKVDSMIIPSERNAFLKDVNIINTCLYNTFTEKENAISELCCKYFVNNANVKEEEKQTVTEYLNILNQLITYDVIMDQIKTTTIPEQRSVFLKKQ